VNKVAHPLLKTVGHLRVTSIHPSFPPLFFSLIFLAATAVVTTAAKVSAAKCRKPFKNKAIKNLETGLDMDGEAIMRRGCRGEGIGGKATAYLP